MTSDLKSPIPFESSVSHFTHWGRDKMDAIWQTTLSNPFSWMKIFEFPLKKFVPKVPINSIPLLFQIMAWRRPGDKPLSEPMMVCLLTHICVTRLNQSVIYLGTHEKGSTFLYSVDTLLDERQKGIHKYLTVNSHKGLPLYIVPFWASEARICDRDLLFQSNLF